MSVRTFTLGANFYDVDRLKAPGIGYVACPITCLATQGALARVQIHHAAQDLMQAEFYSLVRSYRGEMIGLHLSRDGDGGRHRPAGRRDTVREAEQ